MEIVPITVENCETFALFLPGGMLRQKAFAQVRMLVLACQQEEEIMGTVMMEKDEETCVLLWLWVEAQHREKGVGNLLLDAACDSAFQQGALQLEVAYPDSNEFGPVFYYMMARRMCELTVERVPCFAISREQLLASPLMHNTEHGHKKCIVPLQQVPPAQLQELIWQHKEDGDALVSNADFTGADGECSMVLHGGGKIHGLVLLHKNEGVFRLSLFFLEKAEVMKGPALLRAAATAALQPEKGMKMVEFACLEERVLKLAQRLLGVSEVNEQYVGRGLLMAELYNSGRKIV